MRSFADYRKTQLKKDIYAVSIKEGINRHLEMLRLDLLEMIELPPVLMENDFAMRVQYERARKEDYRFTKELVEEIMFFCKDHFYTELLSEAGNTITLQDFGLELNRKIKDMVADLKAVVSNALKGTGTPPPGAPSGAPSNAGPGSPGGNNGSSPSSPVFPTAPQGQNAPSGGQPSPPPSPSNNAPASGGNNASSSSSGGGSSYPFTQQGSARPANGNFTPAPYGNISPSDGIWGGLKRLWRRMTRPIRRVWHGDPTREQVEGIECVILENIQSVLGVIDKFQSDLLQYVNDRLPQVAAATGASPSAVPPAGGPGANGTPGATPGATPTNTLPVDAGETDGTSPDVIAPETDSPLERRAAGGDAEAQADVKDHWDNLDAALSALGMAHSYTRGWRGESLHKKKLIIDGQPLTGKEPPSGLAKKIGEAIYVKIMGNNPDDPFLKTHGLSRRVYHKIAKMVGGIESESPNNMRGLLEILLKLGKGLRNGTIVPGKGAVSAPAPTNASPDAASTTGAAGGEIPAPAPVTGDPNAAGAATAAPATDTIPIDEPQEGDPNAIRAGQEASGWPKDPGALLEKFKNEHPNEYNKLLAYQGGNHDQFVNNLSHTMTAGKYRGVAPHLVVKALINGAKGLKDPKPEAPSPAPQAAPEATPSNTASAAPSNQNVQTFRDRMKKEAGDPGNAEHKHLLDDSRLSDAEIQQIVADKDLSDEEQMNAAILSAAEKISEKGDAPQAEEQPAAPPTPPAPPEEKRVPGGSMKDFVKNRGNSQSTATAQQRAAEPKAAAAQTSKDGEDAVDELLNTDQYWSLINDIELRLGVHLDGPEVKAQMQEYEDEAQNIVRNGGSIEQAISYLNDVAERAKEGMAANLSRGKRGEAKADGDTGGEDLADMASGKEMKKETYRQIIDRYKKMLRESSTLTTSRYGELRKKLLLS